MSLIFSALAEIDKQAQGGQADYAVMSSAATPWYARRGMPALIAVLVLLALCLGGYMLYKSGTHARNSAMAADSASATVPNAAVDDAQTIALAKDAAVVDRQSMAPAGKSPAAPDTGSQPSVAVERDPPYASAPEPVADPGAPVGSMPIRIVNRHGAVSERDSSTAPQTALVDTPVTAEASAASYRDTPLQKASFAAHSDAQSPAPRHPTTDKTITPATAAPSDQSAQVPAQTPTPTQAPPDDAPMIGSNNFIKVGKQPQVAVDTDVSHWVAKFRQAMAQGNQAQAQAALARLEAGLSPQSLTLLRMKAWYAVDSGDDATARSAYARVLQRLPDDINAGVNVALIDWRAGRHGQALRLINSMYTQHPDSDLVKRNWQVMHQQRR